MLKIALHNNQPEIFYTIQGEGKNIGKPSIFIRLSLCNLYCFWCDTDYTWNWQGTPFKHQNDQKLTYHKFKKKENLMIMSNEEIIERLKKYPCQNIVITGGEPLVQKKDLIPFLELLKSDEPNYHIEFETNATIVPDKKLDTLADQYNVSVKLQNSLVAEKERINEKAISFFAQSSKSNFKFVVDNPQDIEEIKAILVKFKIEAKKVYLMPQGVETEILQKKQKWLIEICKQCGFNYTDRLHILVYGDKRGV
ncbi:MAG: 7-carboxy-7-deazaguanine synthase QueE [Raineya sp.]